jgi:YD repeat-containing protein
MLDPLGNVTSYTDKRGLTSALNYDALNRLTKIQYNSSKNTNFPQTTVTYTYDGADRVTQMVDTGGGSPSVPGNTQTFVYDGLNRVTSWTSPEGTVTYTYDNAGNRSTMQAGGQAQINYCYDAAVVSQFEFRLPPQNGTSDGPLSGTAQPTRECLARETPLGKDDPAWRRSHDARIVRWPEAGNGRLL